MKIGVAIDPDLYAWAAARAGPGKQFASFTHAIERGLALLAHQEAEDRAVLAEHAERTAAPPSRRLTPTEGHERATSRRSHRAE